MSEFPIRELREKFKKRLSENATPELFNLAQKSQITRKIKTHNSEDLAAFEKFVGFWQNTSGGPEYFDLFEFYVGEDESMKLKFYTGTSENWRELNNNDIYGVYDSVVDVNIIDDNSVVLLAYIFGFEIIPDEPLPTFRIQDDGSGLIYFDDTPGQTNNSGSTFKKLLEPPVIQKNDEPSLVDWNDPVEMARYVYQYFGEIANQTKRSDDTNDALYVGREKYDENFSQLLTTGWVRTATTTSAFRAGKHIGVWKTQFPESFPVTTLHTTHAHKFNTASRLQITGFSGPFSILNGEHRMAALPTSTNNPVPSYPWTRDESYQYLVMIKVDSSSIHVDYDPEIHGVGKLRAVHQAITPNTEYRDMIASIYDFIASSFGESIHNRLVPWTPNGEIPETFSELNTALKTDLRQSVLRMRSYQGRGDATFYFGLLALSESTITGFGTTPVLPAMNINDPYELGDLIDKSEFNIDIDVENYLQEDKRFNLFWTVTGDPFSAPPLTAILEPAVGYPSNGNKIVFKIAPFKQRPEPLVDEWGEHPYFYYGYISGLFNEEELAPHLNFACGIMKKNKTKNCETVAYIRIVDFLGVDIAGFPATFSTVFGVDGLSNKSSGNEIVAMATVLEELNKYKPDKYIIDLRNNAGGRSPYLNAIPSFFGGNRENGVNYFSNTQDESVPIQKTTESGYESGYNNFQSNESIASLINTDEVAALYPQSMVRSNNSCKKKQVIILTSTNGVSLGDYMPRGFIGPDPTATVHDLGYNVESTVVCDINGRLPGAIRADAMPVNTLEPRLTYSSGDGATPFKLFGEIVIFGDRFGPVNNSVPRTIPDKLLEIWYDNWQWRDIGLVEGKTKYPICGKSPVRSDNTTWRDYVLEEAIAHRSKKKCKKSKCHCKCH
jgi:hypothetical protein